MKKRDIEFEKAIGSKVRQFRQRLGLSQKHLADLANLEQNQIQRVENAKNTTTLAILAAIAKALGKQPYEILKTEYQIKPITDFSVPDEKKLPQTTKVINELVKRTFLNSPRSVSEIITYCKKRYDVDLTSSAASAALKKLVEQKVLKRSLVIAGRFLYQKREN